MNVGTLVGFTMRALRIALLTAGHPQERLAFENFLAKA
jgi:hypothetical protein